MNAEELLARVPQAEPFRFIDQILEVDAERISASVRFREDADFYRGHFPGNPITPGVILVEAMAQAGVAEYLMTMAQTIVVGTRQGGASGPSLLTEWRRRVARPSRRRSSGWRLPG